MQLLPPNRKLPTVHNVIAWPDVGRCVRAGVLLAALTTALTCGSTGTAEAEEPDERPSIADSLARPDAQPDSQPDTVPVAPEIAPPATAISEPITVAPNIAAPVADTPSPAASSTQTTTKSDSDIGDAAVMASFLDRLMQAESGGRDDARNPRSTAVGPYQFIESTFLDVCRRHFAAETTGLTAVQILALRTNRAFARRAAEAFTRDNAALLAASEVPTSKANLRLAFLLGAGGSLKVLKAEPATPVISLLGPGVVQANPFMAGMTARDLALWSTRNLAGEKPGALIQTLSAASGVGAEPFGLAPVARKPVIAITCNIDLPSCKKFVVLAERRAAKKATVAAAPAARRSRVR